MEPLIDWLAAGPFTLALSSSFFGFFAHCGIVTALDEMGLRPAKVTGSSAGALIAGGIASGKSPAEMKELLFSIERRDFWDPAPGLGILRGKKFQRLLEKNFAPSFEEAAIPLEVAAFDLFSMKTQFLRQGSLPKAVAASCAVPGMFHPVRIGARLFYDGGIFNKAALQSEKTDERILCVYLDSTGIAGIYERAQWTGTLAPDHRMLHFKNLPGVNFYSLSGRDEAFKAGYVRARRALEGRWKQAGPIQA